MRDEFEHDDVGRRTVDFLLRFALKHGDTVDHEAASRLIADMGGALNPRPDPNAPGQPRTSGEANPGRLPGAIQVPGPEGAEAQVPSPAQTTETGPNEPGEPDFSEASANNPGPSPQP